MTDRLLTREEAADFLRMSVWTLWYWRRRGEGPACVKISRNCLRYRWADLQAWVRTRVVRPGRSKRRNLDVSSRGALSNWGWVGGRSTSFRSRNGPSELLGLCTAQPIQPPLGLSGLAMF